MLDLLSISFQTPTISLETHTKILYQKQTLTSFHFDESTPFDLSASANTTHNILSYR